MTVILNIIFSVVQLVVGLLLAFLAIYLGVRLFDRILRGVNLIEELRGGNTAVGVFLGGMIIAIATVIQKGVMGITMGMSSGMGLGAMLFTFLAGIVQLAIGVVLAILVVYIAVRIFDKVARGINIIEEIRNRNYAVAAFTAIVLVAVALIIQSAVGGIAAPIGAALGG